MLTPNMLRDQEERYEVMRQILFNEQVLLDVREREVGSWEVDIDASKILIKNVIKEDGTLSEVPFLVYEIVTYEGEIFEVTLRRLEPDDDGLVVLSEMLGAVYSW